MVNSTKEMKVLGIVRRADLSSTYLRYVQGASTPPEDPVPPV